MAKPLHYYLTWWLTSNGQTLNQSAWAKSNTKYTYREDTEKKKETTVCALRYKTVYICIGRANSHFARLTKQDCRQIHLVSVLTADKVTPFPLRICQHHFLLLWESHDFLSVEEAEVEMSAPEATTLSAARSFSKSQEIPNWNPSLSLSVTPLSIHIISS